jgi:hypothetical protein
VFGGTNSINLSQFDALWLKSASSKPSSCPALCKLQKCSSCVKACSALAQHLGNTSTAIAKVATMAYQWPAFANQWGFSMAPFQLRPHIVPPGDGHVRDWKKLMIAHVDWPTSPGLTVAEALRLKMWIIQPFAQMLMPLQHDYILFRRKTLEQLQLLMQAQQNVDNTVITLASNDRANKATIDAFCAWQHTVTQSKNKQAEQLSRTEASLVQVEQHVIKLHAQIHVLECQMQCKDAEIRMLTARCVPWESLDPRTTVPFKQRIREAQSFASARSRSMSPFSSRAPSPAPSDIC